MGPRLRKAIGGAAILLFPGCSTSGPGGWIGDKLPNQWLVKLLFYLPSLERRGARRSFPCSPG